MYLLPPTHPVNLLPHHQKWETDKSLRNHFEEPILHQISATTIGISNLHVSKHSFGKGKPSNCDSSLIRLSLHFVAFSNITQQKIWRVQISLEYVPMSTVIDAKYSALESKYLEEPKNTVEVNLLSRRKFSFLGLHISHIYFSRNLRKAWGAPPPRARSGNGPTNKVSERFRIGIVVEMCVMETIAFLDDGAVSNCNS